MIAKRRIAIAAVLLAWLGGSAAWGQSMEAGANYSWVRANAAPGECGCFSMNGGAGWFAVRFTHSLAVVGEIGSEHASDINGTTGGLTLTSYVAGPRYSLHLGKLSPFGQVLVGGAHATGDLTVVRFGVSEPANSFAMLAGGGLDVELTRHWAVRVAQVDYFLTRFSNGTNDHQNNLRAGGGIVYRFGGK